MRSICSSCPSRWRSAASFCQGGRKNKIKWKTDTSRFYRTLKYFIKSFILLPNKMHRQSAQIAPKCHDIHKAAGAFELYKPCVTRQNGMLPSVLPAVLLFAVAQPELRSQWSTLRLNAFTGSFKLTVCTDVRRFLVPIDLSVLYRYTIGAHLFLAPHFLALYGLFVLSISLFLHGPAVFLFTAFKLWVRGHTIICCTV